VEAPSVPGGSWRRLRSAGWRGCHRGPHTCEDGVAARLDKPCCRPLAGPGSLRSAGPGLQRLRRSSGCAWRPGCRRSKREALSLDADLIAAWPPRLDARRACRLLDGWLRAAPGIPPCLQVIGPANRGRRPGGPALRQGFWPADGVGRAPCWLPLSRVHQRDPGRNFAFVIRAGCWVRTLRTCVRRP